MQISSLLKNQRARHEISEEATIADAMDVMKSNRSRCLMVMDADGKDAGILSEHDIVRAFAQDGDNAKTSYVSDYMTRNVIAVNENETVDSVIDMMTDKNIRHIPVKDDGGTVRGFVSIMELLRARKGL